MRKLMHFSWLALLVMGLATPVALAGKTGKSTSENPQDGVMRVDDKADVFTASGIDTAKAKFEGVTFKAKTHYTVMTRTSVPESKKKDFEATKDDKAKAGLFFSDWAHELMLEMVCPTKYSRKFRLPKAANRPGVVAVSSSTRGPDLC